MQKLHEINIIVKDGGKKEIIVSDNGMGMTSDQLKLCIKRHALRLSFLKII